MTLPQRRAAIVSGAGRGIGAAIAGALAADGCDLIVHYQSNRATAEATGAAIEAVGARAVLVAGPIEEQGTADALVEAALAAFGRLDIVVNNAGITTSGLPLHEVPADEILHQFRVHCHGAFMLTKAAIPHLLRQERGDVIYVSSTAVPKLIPGTGGYAMAKAAAETMAGIMAKELCRLGIHVNIVGPGLTVTDMNMGSAIADAAALAKLDTTMPFGHVCRPEEIGALVAFLVSTPNSYMSGQKIYLDGARGG
ncbi:SDR family NAD(P)-dependent oxidoreductase [Sphingomonas bacterium]|uniref:SDR family NAD(P)-dependent oxidoreductase n=1 Tax=Sphingomonas bacterium TaxID=1895847 RepID=UPI0015754988|nr:SDR family oxidoreductase [Sphingomonas bacterium]